MRRVIFLLLLWSLMLFGAKKEHNMELLSPAFSFGEKIPVKYTCDGKNISIPLVFKDVPSHAKSIVVIMDDPDAPMGVFVHWVIYNIPPSLQALPEGIPPALELEYGMKQGRNDFGKIGYGGPCPPSGVHRYYIKAYALDRTLNLQAGLNKRELLQIIRPYIIDQAVLMGVYGR